jgi:uncharacterized protein
MDEILNQHSKRRILSMKLLFLGIVLLCGIGMYQLFFRAPKVVIRGQSWEVEYAKTSEEHDRGLGFRKSLAPGHGMLFLFKTDDRYGFWMKGMEFPLDIVFIQDGVVVFVERAFKPDDGKVVFPPEPIDTVLEVNANEAQAVQIGDRVEGLPS